MRVMLKGGLGNQLFQICAARLICNITGDDLVIDSSWVDISDRDHSRTLRRHLILFEHEQWGRPQALPVAGAGLVLSEKLLGGTWVLGRNFRPVRFSELSMDLVSTVASSEPEVLAGFFQSREVISSSRRLGLLPEITLPELEGLGLPQRYSVAHFRGGDYGKLADSFGLLSYRYYSRAFEMLRSTDEVIWLTDDIRRLRELLHELPHHRHRILDPKSLNAIDGLAVMASADSLVIANSTFSFWGGELNRKSSKKIMPHPWFREGPHRSLGGDDWIAVEADWQ
jgi:hypothetical protein